MRNGKRSHGQTLVEVALVLPCLCLGISMAVQLMTYCHNMVELARMAQITIDRLSYKNYQAQKGYSHFQSLWGRYSLPEAHFLNEVPSPWRPFKGVSTVKETGRLFSVRLDTRLLPSALLQQAYAETYLEPPIPQEE